jgi:hypothetical protein
MAMKCVGDLEGTHLLPNLPNCFVPTVTLRGGGGERKREKNKMVGVDSEADSSRGGAGEEICHLNYAGCHPERCRRPPIRLLWASLGVGNDGVVDPIMSVLVIEAIAKELIGRVGISKFDCVGEIQV